MILSKDFEGNSKSEILQKSSITKTSPIKKDFITIISLRTFKTQEIPLISIINSNMS